MPSNLKRLKDKIDKLDDDKMKTVPVDLKILNDAVYYEVVEKDVHDELFKKTNAVDYGKFVKKTNCDTDIKGIEDKIPKIACLDTTVALNAVDNKIPYVSNLVKKTEYDAKILDVEKKNLLFLIKINLQAKRLIQPEGKFN